MSGRTGLWRLSATKQSPENLDSQIREILGQLTNDVSIWQDLRKKFKIDLFCGFFMEETNEGLTVSCNSLKMLGERGIELAIDIYANTETSSTIQWT